MKKEEEIKERISLIDDMIFHLENLSTKDDKTDRAKVYREMISDMKEEKNALEWVLNVL